ncbi:Uncharacterized protein FWK35_00014904 [Aphis craccivora]|uniref:Uncharacterized protein n=1 Tax=Aphis craccivora TaxID=307492 RepID=A0A6G0ZMR7_APHCR|nr:Uncharacterized protein FWK35_00014904 [Aphis craccivora]
MYYKDDLSARQCARPSYSNAREEVISTNRSSEAAAHIQMKLAEIPQLLLYGSRKYELRGFISFQKGRTSLRNSIGHYHAYAKRGNRNW